MRAAAAVVVLLVLLAGCSDDGSEVPDPSVVPTRSTSTGPAVVAGPMVEALPFTFDGSLGTSVHGCVFPAGVCETREVVAGSPDLLVERAGANLTDLSFDLTWEAQSPATATLTVGAMVMVSCEGCNDTLFGEVSGTSPIHVEVSGVLVPLHADARVHVYVYNPQGFVYNPAVPAYGLVAIDQQFHIEGTATLSVPTA